MVESHGAGLRNKVERRNVRANCVTRGLESNFVPELRHVSRLK